MLENKETQSNAKQERDNTDNDSLQNQRHTDHRDLSTQYFLRIYALDTHGRKRRTEVREINTGNHYDHDGDRK